MKSVLPGSPWSDMPGFAEIYAAAREAFPGVKLGGGMATYFTELNRKRPPAGLLDYVTHTTCPNVHAADDRSVMETLETLPYLIQSTRSFMGETIGYRIGPSQLGCRENPYGKSTTPNPEGSRVCLSRVDPRQRGLFNAAWILGYVAACARGGVEAVALGAPTGPFGYIERSGEQGGVYPAFHVMAGLAPLSGLPLCEIGLSGHGAVEAVAVRDGGKTLLWVANLTKDIQTVMLPSSSLSIAILDETTVDRMAADAATGLRELLQPVSTPTVELNAYAVACCEMS
jgi:hypothetical protein